MRRRTGLFAAGTALAMTVGVSGAAVASGPVTGTATGTTAGTKGQVVEVVEPGKPAPGKPGKPGEPAPGKPGPGGPDGPSGHGKPDRPGKAGPVKSDPLAAIAKRYGLTLDRLDHALRDVKTLLGPGGGDFADPAVAQVLVKDLGVSTQQARQIIEELFAPGSRPGPGRPGDKPKDDGKPGKPGEPGRPGPAFTAERLAKVLGVSQAKAQTALDSLMKIVTGPKGTIDEKSPAFAAIAAKLGVTPRRLADATRELKSAPADAKPGTRPDTRPETSLETSPGEAGGR
jgi:hypothetical protein